MEEFIEIYRADLEQAMHTQCAVFCTIGSPAESPRWINVCELKANEEGYFIKFQSTQTSRIYFHIAISKEHYERWQYGLVVEELWQPFKDFRTEFLILNYPTIKYQ